MATIMVVDDYPITQRILTYQLFKEGHQVVTASNGHEALNSLIELDVDLMIMDLTMPEMDGMSVLYQLRASSRHATMPIIILTASNKEQDRKQAMSAGANAFLTKPADNWQLINIVDELLVIPGSMELVTG
jgi:CheY-like chemotaxis protein